MTILTQTKKLEIIGRLAVLQHQLYEELCSVTEPANRNDDRAIPIEELEADAADKLFEACELYLADHGRLPARDYIGAVAFVVDDSAQ